MRGPLSFGKTRSGSRWPCSNLTRPLILYPLFANDRATFFVFCGGTQDATLRAPEMDCAPDQLTRIHVDAARQRQESHVPQWAQLEPLQGTRYNLKQQVLEPHASAMPVPDVR